MVREFTTFLFSPRKGIPQSCSESVFYAEMPGVGTNHGTKRNGELTYRLPRQTLSPETKPTESAFIRREVLERGFSVTIKNSAVFDGARQTSMVRVPQR